MNKTHESSFQLWLYLFFTRSTSAPGILLSLSQGNLERLLVIYLSLRWIQAMLLWISGRLRMSTLLVFLLIEIFHL